MKFSKTLLPFLFALICVNPLLAQFEGTVDYRIENYEEAETETSELSLTFTNNRIFILTDDDVDVMSGLSTSGVLVRSDHNDFVFLTGDNEALQVKKDDIDSMVSLMQRMSGESESNNEESFDWNTRVRETGNTRTIQGYEVKEFVLTDVEADGYASVWLTDQIKINWGLLQETWDDVGSKQSDSDLPIEMIMNRNSFPLLIEGFKEGKRVFKVESTSVNTGSFDRSVTEIPSGITLLGFSDMMMNMFRQRR